MSHVFSSPAQLENERLAAFIKQAAPGMPIVCWGKYRGGPSSCCCPHALTPCAVLHAGLVRRGGLRGKHYHYGLVSATLLPVLLLHASAAAPSLLPTH